MTSSLLLSAAAGLVTAVLAALWAALVADGMGRTPDAEAAERRRDIRTW